MTNPTIPELSDSFYNIERIITKKWYKEFLYNYPDQNRWQSIHEEIVNIPKMSKTIPEPVFSYSSKIKSVNTNELVGLLDIEIKENIFFDILRDPITTKLGKVFVVDRAGMIVSNNYPEMFKQNIALLGIDRIINDKVLNEIKKVDGIKSIVISLPVNEIDSSIVGVFPVDNFTNKVKSSIPSFVFVLTASTLLLGFIIFIITNVLLSRIRRLVKAMMQVREGSLNISAPVKSKDEFGKLALSFNHMTGRIHDLVETVYKIQLMEREAELKALEITVTL